MSGSENKVIVKTLDGTSIGYLYDSQIKEIIDNNHYSGRLFIWDGKDHVIGYAWREEITAAIQDNYYETQEEHRGIFVYDGKDNIIGVVSDIDASKMMERIMSAKCKKGT